MLASNSCPMTSLATRLDDVFVVVFQSCQKLRGLYFSALHQSERCFTGTVLYGGGSEVSGTGTTVPNTVGLLD